MNAAEPSARYATLELTEKPIFKYPQHRVRTDKPRDIDQIDQDLKNLIGAMYKGLMKWPLYLNGPPGCGKTCAALALFDRVKDAEFFSFNDYVDFFERVRQNREPSLAGTNWTTMEWRRHMTRLPLMVIDDIGKDPSPDEEKALFDILDARELKPLVVTGNLTPEVILKKYSSRVHSRLCSGTEYNHVGVDRRMRS